MSISPAVAYNGSTINVNVTGQNTNFTEGAGTTLSFSFEQIGSTIVNSYNIINDLNLEANITIPSEIPPGTYNVFTNNSVDGNLTLTNSFQIIETVNIDNLDNVDITVYPNPTTNNLIVSSNITENLQYTIFSINGKTIEKGNINSEITNLNTANLASGIYYIKLNNNKSNLQTFKIIKNK
jgi:hypothetical protein